jgi:hypothetical protein
MFLALMCLIVVGYIAAAEALKHAFYRNADA